MNDETPKDFNPQLAQLSSFLTYRISRVHQKLNVQASRILARFRWAHAEPMACDCFHRRRGRRSPHLNWLNTTAMDKGLVSRNAKSLIESGLVPHQIMKKTVAFIC